MTQVRFCRVGRLAALPIASCVILGCSVHILENGLAGKQTASPLPVNNPPPGLNPAPQPGPNPIAEKSPGWSSEEIVGILVGGGLIAGNIINHYSRKSTKRTN